MVDSSVEEAQVNRILKNSGALTVISLATKAVRYLAIVGIARYLSIADFGKYSLVVATVELFRIVANFEIDTILVRKLARRQEHAERTIGNVIILKLLLSSLALFASIGFALVLGYSDDIVVAVGIAAFALYFSSVSGTLSTHFQSSLTMTRLIPANILGGLTYVALVMLSIWAHLNLISFLVASVVGEVVAMAYVLRMVRSELKIVLEWDWNRVGGLFRDAWALGIIGAVVLTYMRVGTILLSKIGGDTQLAYYSAVYKLTEPFLIVASAVALSTFPILSALKVRDVDGQPRGSHLYWQTYQRLGSLTVVVAGILSLLSKPIVEVLYGPRYAVAVVGLIVMAWSIVVMSLNALSGWLLIAIDKQKILLNITLVALVVNISINLLLIPILGFLGACIATVVTESLNFFIQSIVVRHYLGRWPMSWLIVSLPLWVVGSIALAVAIQQHWIDERLCLLGLGGLFALALWHGWYSITDSLHRLTKYVPRRLGWHEIE